MLQIPPPLLATAVYHAQQAGEKALKAFLAAHNTPFRPTHNLEDLLSVCISIDAGFGQLAPVARILMDTPYDERTLSHTDLHGPRCAHWRRAASWAGSPGATEPAAHRHRGVRARQS